MFSLIGRISARIKVLCQGSTGSNHPRISGVVPLILKPWFIEKLCTFTHKIWKRVGCVRRLRLMKTMHRTELWFDARLLLSTSDQLHYKVMPVLHDHGNLHSANHDQNNRPADTLKFQSPPLPKCFTPLPGKTAWALGSSGLVLSLLNNETKIGWRCGFFLVTLQALSLDWLLGSVITWQGIVTFTKS